MRSDKKNQLLLRRYIRESLTTEVGISDVVKGAASFLGFGKGSGGSGPDKWFADFLGRQLDSAGEKIQDYLGDKLSDVLPDDVKSKLKNYHDNKSGDDDLSTSLAKVVSGWVSTVEELTKKKIPSQQKEELYTFATITFADALKTNANVKSGLVLVKKKLDEKYGPLFTQKTEDK